MSDVACSKCGQPPNYKCERCLEPYCSPNCQILHWPVHKAKCYALPNLLPINCMPYACSIIDNQLSRSLHVGCNPNLTDRGNSSFCKTDAIDKSLPVAAKSESVVEYKDRKMRPELQTKKGFSDDCTAVLPQITTSDKLPKWRKPLPQPNGFFDALVQFVEEIVESMRFICITELKYENLLVKLDLEINRDINQREPCSTNLIKPGALVAAPLDNLLYRAEVLTILPKEGKADVRLIDYGNVIRVPYNQLFEPIPIMENHNAYAVRVLISDESGLFECESILTLRVVEGKTNQGGYYKVECEAKNKLLKLGVVSITEEKSLTDVKTHVAQTKKDFNDDCTAVLPQITTSDKLPKWRKPLPLPNGFFDALVQFVEEIVESMRFIWITELKYENLLVKLSLEINLDINQREPCSTNLIKPGALVAAPLDNLLYRAQVLTILPKEGKADVRLIDYGNVIRVPYNQLFEPIPIMENHNAYAVRVLIPDECGPFELESILTFRVVEAKTNQGGYYKVECEAKNKLLKLGVVSITEEKSLTDVKTHVAQPKKGLSDDCTAVLPQITTSDKLPKWRKPLPLPNGFFDALVQFVEEIVESMRFIWITELKYENLLVKLALEISLDINLREPCSTNLIKPGALVAAPLDNLLYRAEVLTILPKEGKADVRLIDYGNIIRVPYNQLFEPIPIMENHNAYAVRVLIPDECGPFECESILTLRVVEGKINQGGYYKVECEAKNKLLKLGVVSITEEKSLTDVKTHVAQPKKGLSDDCTAVLPQITTSDKLPKWRKPLPLPNGFFDALVQFVEEIVESMRFIWITELKYENLLVKLALEINLDINLREPCSTNLIKPGALVAAPLDNLLYRAVVLTILPKEGKADVRLIDYGNIIRVPYNQLFEPIPIMENHNAYAVRVLIPDECGPFECESILTLRVVEGKINQGGYYKVECEAKNKLLKLGVVSITEEKSLTDVKTHVAQPKKGLSDDCTAVLPQITTSDKLPKWRKPLPVPNGFFDALVQFVEEIVESMRFIWITELKYENLLVKLALEINLDINLHEPCSTNLIKPGALVAAPLDNLLYRAEVLTILPKEGKADVRLIDYGNIIRVPYNQLFEPIPIMENHNAYAVRVLIPDECGPFECESILTLRVVEGKINQGGYYKVECEAKNKLLKLGVVSITEEKSLTDVKTHVAQPKKGLSDDCTAVLPQITTSDKLPKWRKPLPLPNGFFDALVQFVEEIVESMRFIWITELKYENLLVKLALEINLDINLHEPCSTNLIKPGALVAAPLDNLLYRAEVLTILPKEGKADVRLIDYGNIIRVPYNQLFEPIPIMENHNAYAVRVLIPDECGPFECESILTLRVVEGKINQGGYYKVECEAKNKLLKLGVVSITEEKSLTDVKTHVAQTKKGFSDDCTAVLPHITTSDKLPKWRKPLPLPNGFFDALVQFVEEIVESMRFIWITELKYENLLVKLALEINLDINQREPCSTYLIKPGALVAAPLDNLLYRAVVLTILPKEGKADVRLIDYGNIIRVPYNQLFEPIPIMENHNAYAVRVLIPDECGPFECESILTLRVVEGKINQGGYYKVECEAKNKPLKHGVESITKEKSLTVVEKPLQLCYDQIAEGSSVFISHVTSCKQVYIAASSTKEYSSIIMSECQKCEPYTVSEPIREGDVVIVLIPKSAGYRATIIFNDENTVKVRNVDRGSEHVVERKYLLKPTQLITSLPVLCSFVNLMYMDCIHIKCSNNKALAALETCTETETEFCITYSDVDKTIVDLLFHTKERQSLCKKLLPMLFEAADKPPTKDTQPKQDSLLLTPPKTPLTPNAPVTVYSNDAVKYKRYTLKDLEVTPLECGENSSLLVLDAFNLTFLQSPFIIAADYNNKQSLDKWSKELASVHIYCTDPKLPKEGYAPELRELCFCVYPEDGKWYRAICQEIHPNDTFTVMLIDYGSFAKVHKKNIIPMTSELLFPTVSNLVFVEEILTMKRALNFIIAMEINPIIMAKVRRITTYEYVAKVHEIEKYV